MITHRTPITGIGLAFSACNHGLDSRANAHRETPLGQFSTELSTDEDVKTLGIFSSRREATLAIRRVEKLAGFKRYREGFHVDRYRLNERAWTEGFVTVGSSS